MNDWKDRKPLLKDGKQVKRYDEDEVFLLREKCRVALKNGEKVSKKVVRLLAYIDVMYDITRELYRGQDHGR